MYKVKSTYKVLADRAMRHDTGEKYVDWAIEMIENRFETENLFILAGLTPPYNLFQIDELLDKILIELNIKKPDRDTAINGYAYCLISDALHESLKYETVLQQLKDICVTLDYYHPLYSFYLLYFAYTDLKVQSEQYYWKGAARNNINFIVESEFKKWMSTFEASQKI